jgi:hypothetical protein
VPLLLEADELGKDFLALALQLLHPGAVARRSGPAAGPEARRHHDARKNEGNGARHRAMVRQAGNVQRERASRSLRWSLAQHVVVALKFPFLLV